MVAPFAWSRSTGLKRILSILVIRAGYAIDVNSPALKLHLDTFHMNIEEKDSAAPSAALARVSDISTRAVATAALRVRTTSVGPGLLLPLRRFATTATLLSNRSRLT
jgi:hypothetical protein